MGRSLSIKYISNGLHVGNFSTNKDFAANFLAGLLTQNYAKKSKCRTESLSPGLTSVNLLKTSFL